MEEDLGLVVAQDALDLLGTYRPTVVLCAATRDPVHGGDGGAAALCGSLRDRLPADRLALVVYSRGALTPASIEAALAATIVGLFIVYVGLVVGELVPKALALRYTDRRRNIEWRKDAPTQAAVGAIRDLLGDAQTPRFEPYPEPNVVKTFAKT